jgi:hypothetical protein
MNRSDSPPDVEGRPTLEDQAATRDLEDFDFDGASVPLTGGLPSSVQSEQRMAIFVFGSDPDDFSIGQRLDEPGAVEKFAGFLFNPKPRCCTFHIHNSRKYFIPQGMRSRSTGWRCSSCEAMVRKWFFRAKRVYSCKCSFSVLGEGATPFTEQEWEAYRTNTLGRSVGIRSYMEGGEHGGKN